MSYAEAGVDINMEERAIEALDIGEKGYAGIINFDGKKLVLATDGVGSKMIVANAMNRWDSIGIDCVAMNVNDVICVGARPLAFVDYLAMERVDPKITREIGIGLKKGAEIAGVKIVGGETATLPEMINGIDLAGACLGVVEREIATDEISLRDAIIGIGSSGIHSNGLTLARKVFERAGLSFDDLLDDMGDKKIGEELLKPTKIYVKEIMELIKKVEVRGLAHITGGGLRNLNRLNDEVRFLIDEPFEPQPIFKIIQQLGDVSDREMYQTFNMGMGFVVILPREEVDNALSLLDKYGEVKIVGEIVEGKGVELPKYGLKY
jgi:phosphoribosylformylglycinamidine cyclo-ligase